MKQGKSSTKIKNGFVVILFLLFILLDHFHNKTTEILFVFSYIFIIIDIFNFLTCFIDILHNYKFHDERVFSVNQTYVTKFLSDGIYFKTTKKKLIIIDQTSPLEKISIR